MRISNGVVLASLLSSLAIGCGGTSGTSADNSSEYALDTTDVNSGEAAVLTSSVPDTLTATASDDIATAIAAKWAANFSPAGCATSTASGANVTLVLNGCTGPYGLVAATGTIDVAITAAANGFSGVATGSNIALNKATLDINATFAYASTNGTNSLSVQAQGEATGPRGNHLTRNGSYTVTWGSGCLTINGKWTTTVLGLTYQASITDYAQCQGECPQAGGDVSWEGAKRSFDIKFDGTNMAAVSYSGPYATDDSTATLACGSYGS